MLNGSGTPAAALETVELKTRRFGGRTKHLPLMKGR